MVEIALCLGIIAFALVAIVGVLPSGLKVQRENREETIIHQDAGVILEAIRAGAKGADDLTNYVESIRIERLNPNGTVFGSVTYTNDVERPGPFMPLTNGQHIVSLLSLPKYEWLPNGNYRLNSVRARVRSMSGVALDKPLGDLEIDKQRTATDFAFRYELIAEVVPYTNMPPGVVLESGASPLQYINLSRNLYEVRLTARWPLFQRSTGWGVGRYRKTLRTLVSGELTPVYTNTAPPLYLFGPATFTSAY